MTKVHLSSRRGPSVTEISRRSAAPKALQIQHLPIQQVRPNPDNPRTHPSKQIRKLARAIEDFGFLIPVLIDDQDTVLAGHARIEAAKQLVLPSVPCIRASHLTEAQKRTFTILDNRIATEAAWDFQLLAKEIEFLQTEDIDLTTTGFEIPEIEMILDAGEPRAGSPEDDKAPNLDPGGVVTNPNDLWILGDHRLLCGESAQLRSQRSRTKQSRT